MARFQALSSRSVSTKKNYLWGGEDGTKKNLRFFLTIAAPSKRSEWSAKCSLSPPLRAKEVPGMNPEQYDLEALKAELEEYGFVVLHNVIPTEQAGRMAKRIMEIMSRQPNA